MKRMMETCHGEAFALMTYVCERQSGSSRALAKQNGCGHKETIWNTRDGVTPFGIACPKCGGSMLHAAPWSNDEFAPFHVPKAGDRVFVDCTPESARFYAKRQTEQWIEKGWNSSDPEMTPERLEEIRYQDILGDGVSPDVRTVKSAREIYKDRRGIGYAGLRGLIIEFAEER